MDDDDFRDAEVCHTDLCSHQRVTVEALEWALGRFRGDMRLVSLRTYAQALRDVLDEYQEADRHHRMGGEDPAVDAESCDCGVAYLHRLATGAVATPDTLDAAWARMEVLLPDGWVFGQVKRFPDDGYWQAQALHPRMLNVNDFRHGDGPSPIAALLALAAALEARRG